MANGKKHNPLKIANIKICLNDLFSSYLCKKFCFHNFDYTLRVTEAVKLIGNGSGCSKAEIYALQVAALFHKTGIIVNPADLIRQSQLLAQSYLSQNGMSGDRIQQICSLIKIMNEPYPRPVSKMEKISCDAITAYYGECKFLTSIRNQRSEFINLHSLIMTEMSWVEMWQKIMLRHQFYMPVSNRLYGHKKTKNVIKIKSRIIKLSFAKQEQLKRLLAERSVRLTTIKDTQLLRNFRAVS